MSRLTIEEIEILKKEMKSNLNFVFYEDVVKVFDELLKYRKLGEQGFLKILPCKEGKTIYAIDKVAHGHWEKDKYIIDDFGEWRIYEKPFSLLYISEIGKTVFLTQAEAEEALKRLEVVE